MNKNLHRIVFNAARGMRMVVQETARSAGKATTAASGIGVALSALFGAASAQAQIIGAPNVPANQRPIVLAAPNGVPVANIQTPGAAGVSRNVYSRFDVQSNGLILNNSRTDVQTQLGGWVQGNPYLATGPARIILNEINSGSPTQLRGALEVAGQKAEVVVANPAGIAVDGSTFINASQVTLTTGVPQLNTFGGLDGYRVSGGTVSIDGKGLDLSGTDYAAIYARALQVNASIWANELKVVTGANEIGVNDAAITPIAGTGPAPAFALDVAALGGMYANKITLVGSEAGLGVRNAGNIGAGAGGLVVTAEGRLENSGTIEGQRIELASAAGDVVNSGTIRQTGTAALTIAAASLSNTAGGAIGAEPAPAAPAPGTAGSGSTGSNDPVTSGGAGGSGATTPTAVSEGGTTDAAAYVPPSPGSITAANGAIRNDGGRIYAGGPITLQTPQVNNAGGSLAVTDLAVTGPNFSNAGGTLNIANSFSAKVGSFDNSAGGKLHAGTVSVDTTGDFNNADGSIQSNGDVAMNVGGAASNERGTISAAGALTATVSGAIRNASGTLAANQAISVQGQSLDNTLGSVTSAAAGVSLNVTNALANSGNIGAATDLSIRAGSLANSGTLRGGNDSAVAVAGQLANDGSITAARNTTVDAGSLQGGAGSVLGAGIHADGTLGTAGDLRVTTTGALVAQGQNLAAGTTTMQGASVDLSGSTTGGANIALTASQGNLTTSGATVVTPGALTLRADTHGTQSLVNQGGTLSAGALDLRTANLDNSAGGRILQTGSGATTIAASGTMDNNSGLIASNGNTAISAGALSNQGGAVRAAGGASLGLDVVGALDNSQQGEIGADGNTTLRAGTLKNDGGKLTAGVDLAVTVQGQASNLAGLIAANGNTTLAASALDNSTGTVAAVGQDLSLTTSGATINAGGTLQAGGNTTLVNAGLDNSAGKLYGTQLSIDTHGQQFTNTQGILVASQTAQLQTGTLVNDAGLIQAGTGLSIDTHGQSLTNTNTLGTQLAGPSATPHGILSGGALQLAAGALDNTTGYIRAAEAVTATTDGFTNNGGAVLGGAAMAIDAQGSRFTNSGGQVQAVGDLRIGAGAIDNSAAGLIRAGGTTTLAATQIDNGTTLGTDQGIEGAEVAITTHTLANQGGAIRASGNATITSAGSIDNTAGLISAADTLTLQDPNRANPGAKTLSIINTGGTLAGGTAADPASGTPAFGGLVIDAARYQVGQVDGGTLASANDLAIALTQDVSNSATLSAGGNLTVSTTGKLANTGQLLAGHALSVSANAIDNAASGELSGSDTRLVAGSVTNRGLIDSNGETRIDASTDVDNVGTGRIYGDHVAIGTGTLTNDAESVNGTITSGSIASRGDLDIGATQIHNGNGALIHSEGDLYVGGALDANGYATGTAAQLNNHSADLESIGNMDLAVANVDNRDTQLQVIPGAQVEHSSRTDTAFYLGNLGFWTYDTTITTDGIANTRPAVISAGGDLTLTGNLVNRDSKVLAGYDLTIHGSVDSRSTQGQRIESVHTTVLGIDPGGNAALFDLGTVTTPTSFDLTAYGPPQGHQAVSAVGGKPGASSTGSGSGSAGGAGTAKAGQGAGTILEVPSAVGSGSGVTGADANGAGPASQGAPMVVRTATPGTQLPTASLFKTRPEGGAYLIETDPRFTNYRQWLGSDYLFNQLGLDPNNLQKRLGDAFYEQRLIREQVAQLTGNRFLGGYSDDQSEYVALMDAGATFAKKYNLTPGIALTPEQMAQLTSDIVWMVSQTVQFPDGSTQQVLVPQVYVRVQPGDIDGHGALLSADRVKIDTQPGAGAVTNSGTIAGRSLVSITADDIRNVDGGRITGGSVALTARNDLDNIGATIDARKSLSLAAGNDINIASTTSATTLDGVVNGQVVDRLAGVYVTGDSGLLVASAGRDVNMTGALIASDGSAAIGAGRNINIGTVTESSSTSAVSTDGKAAMATSQSREIGSAIVANGDMRLAAGNDLNIRASGIASADGALIATARNDINITAGEATSSVATATVNTSKSVFKKTTTSAFDSTSTTEVLSSSLSGKTVALVAGNDINAQAAQLRSDEAMSLSAGRDINLTTANRTTEEQHASQSRSSGTGLGKALGASTGDVTVMAAAGNKESNSQTQSTTTVEAIGTTVSAGSLQVVSGRDATLQGATVVADGDITMVAGRNLTIESAQSTRVESGSQSSSKSGMVGTWYNPAIGNVKSSESQARTGTSQVSSQVASLQGDVTLVAGDTYRQTASSVMALGQAGSLVGGDVNILAKNVLINEAYNTEQTTAFGRNSSTIIGGSASVGGISTDSLRNTNNTLKAIGDTSDSRMQALGAANLAMSGKQAYDTVSSIAIGGGVGYKVSVNVSHNKSEYANAASGSEAVGSSIVGAKNVNIVATGGGEGSNIHAIGSTIAAGDTVNLAADNAITLEASKNTFEQHGTNSSSGASVGVGFAAGSQNGFTLELGVSQGKGNSNQNDVTYNNTRVSGGNAVNITSGGDLNIKGGVVEGNRVTADVGGNLNIESLQDTSVGQSRQSSSGVNLSLCIPPFCYGVSTVGGNAASAKANGNFVSVGEQSGIKAGDGGFDVNVKGNSDLKGAVIESTQAAIDAGKNNFQTGGTLTLSDLQNVSQSSGSSYAVSGSVGFAVGDQSTATTDAARQAAKNAGANSVPGGAAGVGSSDSSKGSVTKSGISGIAGDEGVRTGDNSSAGTLVKDWNTQTILKDVQAQAQITQQFNQQAAQAVGSYANQKYNELKDKEPAEAAKWAEGGEYRVAMHTIAGGLSGGLQGALGAGASQAAIDEIGQQIASADLPLVVKQTLAELAGAAVGAAVGGSAGAASGFTATVNNYLTVADLKGDKGTKKEQQTQSLANNAKVEEPCVAKNSEACGKAIAQAASDVKDLRDYRADLIAKKDSENDPAAKADLAYQITQVDKQIDSANNVIRVGGMALNDGNFNLGNMTDKELIAMGFAFDPLGAAEVRAAGKTSTSVNTIIDNIAYKAEQARAQGADSALQGARLNMQLSAEQAAGTRAPQSITSYSDHAASQMAGRDGGIGVNPAAVSDAFANPLAIQYVPSKYGPTFKYIGQNATVVVNPQGNVVTTWGTSSAGVGR